MAAGPGRGDAAPVTYELPPATTDPTTNPTTDAPPDRANLRVLLPALVVALAVAVGVGVALGWEAYEHFRANDRPEDTWADLGNAFGALILGGLTGCALYLVAVVVIVRRTVGPGLRLATVVTALLATAALPAFSGRAVASAEAAGLPALAVPVLLAGAVAAGAVIGLAAEAVRPERGLLAVAVAGLCLVGVSAVGAWRGDDVADSRRATRYEEIGAPLALVGGRDLAVPAEGWELVSVDPGYGDDVSITFDVPVPGRPHETEWVELDMAARPDPVPCGPDAQGTTCVLLGRTVDGAEIRGREVVVRDGVGVVDVWVDVPGGRWTVSGTSYPQPVDVDAAIAVLRALEPVDAGTFAAAT
jgi:hypothetical protein